MRVLNADGTPFKLQDDEVRLSTYWTKRLKNELGYEVDITTLTALVKKVSEQKFYTLPFADYVPVVVGQGAFNESLLTYLTNSLAGDFEAGNINTGGDNDNLESADAGVSSQTIKIINWAKRIGWTVFELKLAQQSGNWSLIEAKEKSRKQNWDLGLQAVAMLGSKSNSAVKGLLSLTGVLTNTTLITKAISSMTAAELKTFVRQIVGVYRANNNYTAMPTHFAMPESDFNGCATPSSADFPLKSVLDILLETFKTVTQNPNFIIKPLAYGEASVNTAWGINKQRYALYNYDDTSINMNIPVDYTNTLANSLNGFNFQNAAYGQYTGVQALRPKEIVYFQY